MNLLKTTKTDPTPAGDAASLAWVTAQGFTVPADLADTYLAPSEAAITGRVQAWKLNPAAARARARQAAAPDQAPPPVNLDNLRTWALADAHEAALTSARHKQAATARQADQAAAARLRSAPLACPGCGDTVPAYALEGSPAGAVCTSCARTAALALQLRHLQRTDDAGVMVAAHLVQLADDRANTAAR